MVRLFFRGRGGVGRVFAARALGGAKLGAGDGLGKAAGGEGAAVGRSKGRNFRQR